MNIILIRVTLVWNWRYTTQQIQTVPHQMGKKCLNTFPDKKKRLLYSYPQGCSFGGKKMATEVNLLQKIPCNE